MRGDNNAKLTVERVEKAYARVEDPDYYGVRPPASSGMWAATIDALVERGKCGRTPRRGGCE